MKHCPFCGSSKIEIIERDGDNHVQCRSCFVANGGYKTKEEAVNHWNSREQDNGCTITQCQMNDVITEYYETIVLLLMFASNTSTPLRWREKATKLAIKYDKTKGNFGIK